jgi:hypothetical protein
VAVSGEQEIELRFMRSSPLDMTREEWERKADALWDGNPHTSNPSGA